FTVDIDICAVGVFAAGDGCGNSGRIAARADARTHALKLGVKHLAAVFHEEAVRCEIREEASIEVKDIRYFGSQTWPYPSNIMIGFRAEYATGELKPDGDEVIESGWFDREHLPQIPRSGSIARTMLDAWVATGN
ncbi:MAG: NUDIX domain-containing protein, partial [Kiritimatiellae bacterium]|nr:NUDIX domain-containing protein [Kiritimatiellia bacterium]